MIRRPTPIHADEQKPDFTKATSCQHKVVLSILQKGTRFEGPACSESTESIASIEYWETRAKSEKKNTNINWNLAI